VGTGIMELLGIYTGRDAAGKPIFKIIDRRIRK
jgi:hypothetical protein